MNKNKYLIKTGIGLQDVDNLKNSSYFIKKSEQYIKGEIDINELDKLITSYYSSKKEVNKKEKEADKVSIRIAKILSDDSFDLSLTEFKSIHYNLFVGILDNPGEFRKYNFSKKEWVLNGNSVKYGDYLNLDDCIRYDLKIEKEFSYKGLSIDKVINHLSIFISNLWQNHVFSEGNTRTIAIFLIKYLNYLGFDISNDLFEKYSWYFRNAIVRANYTNIPEKIYADRSYLILFLRNLLLKEKNKLSNKELHVDYKIINSESNEEKILKLIKNNPTIKNKFLGENLKVSVRTINSLLKKLKVEKKIKRINGKRFGYWEIIK